MSNNDSINVSAGKPKSTGAIFVAPPGTALPADGVAPLGAEFVNIGFISEDGVTNEVASDVEEIKAWGGDTVLAVQTSHSEKFGFTAIETNVAVLKEYYGAGNVEASGAAITVKSRAGDADAHPWVIETLMNGGRVQRIVIPNGKIGERGEISYVDNEAIGYEMSVTALPDADGVKSYKYIASAGEAA